LIVNNVHAGVPSKSITWSALPALAPLSAHADGVDGTFNGQDFIRTDQWDTLTTLTVPANVGERFCMVVCSVQATNPADPNTDMNYHLAVTIAGGVVGGSERRFEFENNTGGIRDVSYIEVSTVGAFALVPNFQRVISCSARKDTLNNPDLEIQNSSMAMQCSNTELDPNPGLTLILMPTRGPKPRQHIRYLSG